MVVLQEAEYDLILSKEQQRSMQQWQHQLTREHLLGQSVRTTQDSYDQSDDDW